MSKKSTWFVLPWFINRVFVEYLCSRYNYVTITNAINVSVEVTAEMFLWLYLVKMSPNN